MHSALLLVLLSPVLLPAGESAPTPEGIKAAVARALPLLQKSAAQYTEHRQCFACHHQTLPMLAVVTARQRGFDVSAEGLQKQLEFTSASLTKNRDNYRKGRGQGGQVDTAGYALLTLELGGWKPDATTEAVAEYLLQWNKDLEHWRVTARRPPSEASSFTANYLALRALQTFGITEQKDRIEARTAQVRRWLLATPAKDTEDRVFRLLALKAAGVDAEAVQTAVRELLETQWKDGGWSQTRELEGDAYATGSALVALHWVGGLDVSDPVYQAGVRFLLRTQLPDGSWYVKSRSVPFQTYFESGFPHGKDQFISVAASGWATTALALTCPPRTP